MSLEWNNYRRSLLSSKLRTHLASWCFDCTVLSFRNICASLCSGKFSFVYLMLGCFRSRIIIMKPFIPQNPTAPEAKWLATRKKMRAVNQHAGINTTDLETSSRPTMKSTSKRTYSPASEHDCPPSRGGKRASLETEPRDNPSQDIQHENKRLKIINFQAEGCFV